MECLKENQQMTLLADSRILTGTFDYSFEKATKIYWYHECCRFVSTTKSSLSQKLFIRKEKSSGTVMVPSSFE
jgi:hypothetical protein